MVRLGGSAHLRLVRRGFGVKLLIGCFIASWPIWAVGPGKLALLPFLFSAIMFMKGDWALWKAIIGLLLVLACFLPGPFSLAGPSLFASVTLLASMFQEGVRAFVADAWQLKLLIMKGFIVMGWVVLLLEKRAVEAERYPRKITIFLVDRDYGR